MFIDLDGFKRINDTYGHATGDRLLCEVSVRLAATLRESDTIGRLGGDEFVILVESDSFDLGAERIADRIRDALAEPFFLGGPQEVAVVARASIGIAVGLRSSADELLRDADVALYARRTPARTATCSSPMRCRPPSRSGCSWRWTCATRRAPTSSSCSTSRRSTCGPER